MAKKLLAIFLTAVLLVCTLAVTVNAATINTVAMATSGTCGDGLSYTLDLGTGVLRVFVTDPDNYDVESHDYAIEDGKFSWENYSDSSSIIEVIIEDGVKLVGQHVFNSCENLESVTFCDGNTAATIGESAFASCEKLETIVFGNRVTTIDEYAFQDCPALNSITIPNSVTSVGVGTFSDCGSIKIVVIPDTLQYVGCEAFNSNPIESVYLQGNVDANYFNLLSYEGGDVDADSTNLFANNPAIYYLNGGYINSGDSTFTPVKEGNLFAGYYTAATGGSAATPSAGDEVYAHWVPLTSVTKDSADKNVVAGNRYGAFDLSGVQIRDLGDASRDGLRFIASFNEGVYDQLKALNNNVSYGFVAAAASQLTSAGITDDLTLDLANSTAGRNAHVQVVDCSRDKTLGERDHRNFAGYRLYTLVVTYDGVDASMKNQNIVARAYLTYTDANGVSRTYYNTYSGASEVNGGCSTNYSAVAGIKTQIVHN